MKKWFCFIAAIALISGLTACGTKQKAMGSGETEVTNTAAGQNNQTENAVEEKQKSVEHDLAEMTWDEVLAEANGQTVTWYLWGGSTATNDFIDNVVGNAAAEYGIKINRVGVNNITEAVNLVIGEKQANKDTNGTADLFWINGSNFMMMKQAGVTFPSWAELLPNSKAYVDWNDYSIAYDMGFKVEGHESPWMAAQLLMIYDSDRMSEDELPRNYAELLEWAKANPGRFTFPAPPDFTGTRFIKCGMYELTGGYEEYAKEDITIEAFETMSQPMWDWLEEIKPYLWRKGETFPQTANDCSSLFNNNEIDFALSLNGMGITEDINSGIYPKTAKVYCMDTSIADTNYVALSYNGANKAGALVIANILLDPEIQAKNIEDTSGAPIVDFTKLSEEQKARFDEATSKLMPGTYASPDEKARTRAPEVSSYLNPYIEQLFIRKAGK